MEFLGIVKIVSMVASGVFGALAVVTDYKDKNQKLTRWGKFAVTGVIIATVLSLVLHYLESKSAEKEAEKARQRNEAVAAQLENILTQAASTNVQQQRTLGGMQQVLGRQEEAVRQGDEISSKVTATLDTQRQITNQVLRAYYPLEPLTLFFERELPMDQPALSRYVARIQKSIAAKLRARRTDGKPVPDDLRGEYVDIMEEADWLPVADGPEHPAYRTLLTETASFTFLDDRAANDIQFSTFPSGTQVLSALSSGDRMVQKIRLAVDFRRRVITKIVRCDFAVRSGADVSAVSAIDLIDRRLSAPRDASQADVDSRVTRVALKFRYDYDLTPTRERYIMLPADGSAVRVTPVHVGLAASLFKGSSRNERRR